MALDFMLLDAGGRPIVGLADPAGGRFDWAGDFDRLLPLATVLPLNLGFDLAVLSRVEAFEDVYFAAEDMPVIIDDVLSLLPLADPGPETDGLNRLRVMAEHGTGIAGSSIRVRGD